MLLRLFIAFLLTIPSLADPDDLQVEIDFKTLRGDLMMLAWYYNNGGNIFATGYIDLGNLASIEVRYLLSDETKETYLHIPSYFVERNRFKRILHLGFHVYDGGLLYSCQKDQFVGVQGDFVKSTEQTPQERAGNDDELNYEPIHNTERAIFHLKYIKEKKMPYVLIKYWNNVDQQVVNFFEESDYTRGECVSLSSDDDRSYMVFYYGYSGLRFENNFYKATGRQPHSLRTAKTEYAKEQPGGGDILYVKRRQERYLRYKSKSDLPSTSKCKRSPLRYRDNDRVFLYQNIKEKNKDIFVNQPRRTISECVVEPKEQTLTRMFHLGVRHEDFEETRWLTLDDLQLKNGFNEILSVGHFVETTELLSIVGAAAEPKETSNKNEETISKPILLLVQGHILERSKNPDSEKEPKCEYIVEYESRIGSFKMTGHEGTKMLVCLKSKQVYLVDGQDVPHLTNSVILSFEKG